MRYKLTIYLYSWNNGCNRGIIFYARMCDNIIGLSLVFPMFLCGYGYLTNFVSNNCFVSRSLFNCVPFQANSIETKTARNIWDMERNGHEKYEF